MARAGRVMGGLAILVGAFVLCAGIPLGVLYLLARLGWPFLASLALGLTVGPLAMVALGLALARLEAVCSPRAPLLEASIVAAVVITVAGITVWLVFFSGGGGTFGPFPD